MSQTDLAKKMGLGKAWVSKLLNGGIKQLSDENTDALEEILGISFFQVVESTKVPDLAIQLGEKMEERTELVEIVSGILKLDSTSLYTIPHLPTKDLVDFGKAINKAAHENPDKDGKIGRIAIEWLSSRLKKLAQKS